jgi:hypothetical protein
MNKAQLIADFQAQPWFGAMNGPEDAVQANKQAQILPGGALMHAQSVLEVVGGLAIQKTIWYVVLNEGSNDAAKPETAYYTPVYPAQVLQADPTVLTATAFASAQAAALAAQQAAQAALPSQQAALIGQAVASALAAQAAQTATPAIPGAAGSVATGS